MSETLKELVLLQKDEISNFDAISPENSPLLGLEVSQQLAASRALFSGLMLGVWCV